MRRNLKVSEAMSSPVVAALPTATLEELAELMLSERVGSVVIVDGERPVGIVTETDFEVRDDPIPLTVFRWPKVFGRHVWSERSMEDVYARARGRTADMIMSAPPLTVDANADLWDAVRIMVENDVKRVPAVVGDRLVGVVSRHDLLKCLLPETD